jgi:hypothetical protein
VNDIFLERLNRLTESYNFLREAILDLVEQELGDTSPRWPFLRSRLLRYLGDGGFGGRLATFLEGIRKELERSNEC